MGFDNLLRMTIIRAILNKNDYHYHRERDMDQVGKQRRSEDQAGSAEQFQYPTVASRDLLCGGRKLLIDHDGEIYHLNVTRQGKLILTK